MPEQFTVGPPAPVEDSRELPAVTPDDEAGFVSGDQLEEHPDNAVDAPVDEDEDADPTDDELDALVSDVAVDDVDQEGFGPDPSDFVGLDLGGEDRG
jgi:hypothetical protein